MRREARRPLLQVTGKPVPPLSGPLPRIKQKGIKQKGIKQKGIKQKGIKQKGITGNKGRILTEAVILLILSITLVTGAACAKDAPSTSERAQEDGHDPVLRCTYYPQYNKSLLYVRDFYIDEMGMTDEFFDGNICRENPGRTRN